MNFKADFTMVGTADYAPTPDRFDRISRTLHWATVLLFTFQLVTAYLPHEGGGARILLALHRSAGVLTLAVVLFRVTWRLGFAGAPPFPQSMPVAQRWAARANEGGLYVLLAIQPLTGLADGVFHGRPFVLFGLAVPALMPFDRGLFHLSGELHELGAKLLLALVALHVGAALLHGFVWRDGVLQRMWPKA